jgi:hypothetical protein
LASQGGGYEDNKKEKQAVTFHLDRSIHSVISFKFNSINKSNGYL